MNLNFEIVLGANWGDEGKGLITAQLTKTAFEKYPEKRVLNVLFSGGAQRGHTVDYTKVLRHVYRHLGAGTLHGADTYMNKDFMVNPTRLTMELQDLGSFIENAKLNIWIHKDCRVTTPYDIFMNRKLEDKRKNNRHGSCGLGIYECKKRYDDDKSMPRYGELVKSLNDDEKKKEIENKWFKYFMDRANETEIDVTAQDVCDLNYEIKEMLDNLREIAYLWATPVSSLQDILYGGGTETRFSTVIYEGSQGVMLSATNTDDFPHLTPADTTGRRALAEIVDFINNHVVNTKGININVDYVTRTYFTRHGTDPKFKGTTNIKDEQFKDLYSFTIDKTNRPNPYQGEFKYAPMDLNVLFRHLDFNRVEMSGEKSLIRTPSINFTETLHVTHVNEAANIKEWKTFSFHCNNGIVFYSSPYPA